MTIDRASKIEKIFSDVPSEHRFWLVKGGEIGNLEELDKALEEMDNDTFKHHVTDKRNDFEVWVRNSIKDETLADTLVNIKSKDATYKAVKLRIKSLKNIQTIHSAIENVKSGKPIPKAEESSLPVPKEVSPDSEEGVQHHNYHITHENRFLVSIAFVLGILIGFVLGVVVGFLI